MTFQKKAAEKKEKTELAYRFLIDRLGKDT